MAKMPWLQAGALVWRSSSRASPQVLLVSTRGGGWTIPKGHVVRRASPRRCAAREAFEEAGVLGAVGESIGRYEYRKRGDRHVVLVHPITPTVILPAWPEALRRRRIWVELDEAVALVRHDGLAEMLRGATRLQPVPMLAGA